MKKAKRFTQNTLVKLTSLSLFMTPAGALGQNLNCPQPMVFGSIMPCAGTGTVTVNPQGSTGSTGCVTVGGAPQNFARCVVTQSFPFRPIQFQITPTLFTMANGAGSSMDVNQFNLITDGGGYTQTRAAAPFINVPIGGTLNVKANQDAGSYSGTFTLTATLQ